MKTTKLTAAQIAQVNASFDAFDARAQREALRTLTITKINYKQKTDIASRTSSVQLQHIKKPVSIFTKLINMFM